MSAIQCSKGRWKALIRSSRVLSRFMCFKQTPTQPREKLGRLFLLSSHHVAFLSNQLSSLRAPTNRAMHIHKWHQPADWCNSFSFVDSLNFLFDEVSGFEWPAVHLDWCFIIMQYQRKLGVHMKCYVTVTFLEDIDIVNILKVPCYIFNYE